MPQANETPEQEIARLEKRIVELRDSMCWDGSTYTYRGPYGAPEFYTVKGWGSDATVTVCDEDGAAAEVYVGGLTSFLSGARERGLLS